MKISRRRLYLALCLIVGVAISLLINALTPLQPEWLLALDIPELPDVNTSPLLLPESQAMQSPINPPGPGGGGPGASTPTPTPEPELTMNMAEFYDATSVYASGSFCILKENVAIEPLGDYGLYFPVMEKDYRDIPDNGFGVAGADHGGDGRGECPGTNDMLSLGLPHSLSYHWNFVYAPDNPDLSTHSNSVQMVYNPFRSNQAVSDSLKSFVEAYSNTVQVWILGNEPDRLNNGTTMCPAEYAKNYHAYRKWILDIDDSAEIAIAAISENPNLRILTCHSNHISETERYTREGYITEMLTSYAEEFEAPMPIDIWTTHQYPDYQTTTIGEIYTKSVQPWVAELKSITRFIREFSDTGYYSTTPYITAPIWLTEYGYHWFGQDDRIEVDRAVEYFVQQSTSELQSLSGVEKIDYSFWFFAHSNYTAYRCTGTASYSGFLFEQVESTWGKESAPETPLSVTANSITISSCISETCGFPESGLPDEEMWDRYTFVYFKNAQKDDKKVFRISEVSEGISDTYTLTLCNTITPSNTMSDFSFWLVRQRPEFDGENMQFVLSPVGETYVTATMP